MAASRMLVLVELTLINCCWATIPFPEAAEPKGNSLRRIQPDQLQETRRNVPGTDFQRSKFLHESGLLTQSHGILGIARAAGESVVSYPHDERPIKFRDQQHLLEILGQTYHRAKLSHPGTKPNKYITDRDRYQNTGTISSQLQDLYNRLGMQYHRTGNRIQRDVDKVNKVLTVGNDRIDTNVGVNSTTSIGNDNNNTTVGDGNNNSTGIGVHNSTDIKHSSFNSSTSEAAKSNNSTATVLNSEPWSSTDIKHTITLPLSSSTFEAVKADNSIVTVSNSEPLNIESSSKKEIRNKHGIEEKITVAPNDHLTGNTGTLQDTSNDRRFQKVLTAMQEVADAFLEVPRQLWLLPIRFGFYPGLLRTQDEIPGLVSFPCRQNKSTPPPTSVHRLRPGDVRVVAALGDSLTAANGAMAYSEEETRLNYRGVSAMAGGQENWRKYLTLPNILKEFNPKLLGYALGAMDASSPISGLNVAQNGALDDELLQQAKFLVRKMRDDPFIDIHNDWKLLTVLIGSNDLCNEYCYSESDKDSPGGHSRQLEDTLDFLQRNLPRTLVNLVHIPNLLLLRNMKNIPFVCYMKRLVLCSCLFGGAERAKAESVARELQGYWAAERSVAQNPRYDTDNFTVVLQPFFLGVDSPDHVNTWFGEAPDLSFFAPDCFHFSQKGNSLVANALWNNLLEPVGRKTFGWNPLMERFLCPTENAPFLFTRRNSRTFLGTGRQ